MKVNFGNLRCVLRSSFGILGHRLKSANNKTSKMFENLKTPRRIILSGTPIQNDLGEFHAMVRHITFLIPTVLR